MESVLHLFTFKSPTSSQFVSENATLLSAFSMLKGVEAPLEKGVNVLGFMPV